jgi:hypothetical protein
MPASGRFESRIPGKQDAQDASHNLFRPTHDSVSILSSHTAPLFQPTLASPASAIRCGIESVGRAGHCEDLKEGWVAMPFRWLPKSGVPISRARNSFLASAFLYKGTTHNQPHHLSAFPAPGVLFPPQPHQFLQCIHACSRIGILVDG